MSCKLCASDNQRRFSSEIAVHFSGLTNLDKLPVFVFPKLLVCMDCGFTEFAIPESELCLLGKEARQRVAATSRTPLGDTGLSEFVVGLPFSTAEIKTSEYAADKPLALKNGFYRQ